MFFPFPSYFSSSLTSVMSTRLVERSVVYHISYSISSRDGRSLARPCERSPIHIPSPQHTSALPVTVPTPSPHIYRPGYTSGGNNPSFNSCTSTPFHPRFLAARAPSTIASQSSLHSHTTITHWSLSLWLQTVEPLGMIRMCLRQ
jgi:hypothetical protein